MGYALEVWVQGEPSEIITDLKTLLDLQGDDDGSYICPLNDTFLDVVVFRNTNYTKGIYAPREPSGEATTNGVLLQDRLINAPHSLSQVVMRANEMIILGDQIESNFSYVVRRLSRFY